MYWADSIGAKYIHGKLEEWTKRYGGFFKPCSYLAERAAKGIPLVSKSFVIIPSAAIIVLNHISLLLSYVHSKNSLALTLNLAHGYLVMQYSEFCSSLACLLNYLHSSSYFICNILYSFWSIHNTMI
jgi:hypothetical protein